LCYWDDDTNTINLWERVVFVSEARGRVLGVVEEVELVVLPPPNRHPLVLNEKAPCGDGGEVGVFYG
jgi:hypothetical protein